jgi:peptidyl-prolyl cis-trans isomerase D
MAVLGKIRKRVGLLIGFVGISMVLFILGDLVTSNTGLMHRNSDVIGEIGGQKVHYQEFEKRVETLTENYKANSKTENIDQNTQDMLREQAWSMYVNDNVLGKEYEKLGLTCSAEELYDMCTGKNPNPQVKQAFTDPKTGQFNSSAVVNFLKDLPNREEDIQRQWRTFEDAIKEERVATKYKNLIKSGIFVNTEEAKRGYEESQRAASIRFVRLDLNSILDKDVKVEDSELNDYYNENKSKYKQAETIRKVEYITFDITPTQEDRDKILNDINKIKEEFAQSTDDKLFVNQNSDTPFDSVYHAKGTLKPEVDSILFASPKGTIIGPMEDGNSIKLWKLTDEKFMSDSVKARHILIKIENNDTAKAMAKADSLKNAIKKGSKFDELAKMYSTDQGSAIKGGDLGWFRQGMMVAPFNDASFNGKKGDLPIVISQFGVHLIEILDKGPASKQIQVATIERKLVPSDKTYEIVYNKASEFAFKNNTSSAFDSAIVKQNLNKRIADNLRESDKSIPGLEQPRELIRWAYTAKKGDVSKVFTFGDKNVIAHLVDIREKGYLPLESVKDQVTTEVRKKKKAEMLEDKFNKASASSIDAIAQKLNVTASDAENVMLSNSYVPGLGNEPAIVGQIFAMKPGQLSKPIKGETCVTVVLLKEIKNLATTTDYSPNAKQMADQRKQRGDYEVFNALKEKANVEDLRGKFY